MPPDRVAIVFGAGLLLLARLPSQPRSGFAATPHPRRALALLFGAPNDQLLWDRALFQLGSMLLIALGALQLLAPPQRTWSVLVTLLVYVMLASFAAGIAVAVARLVRKE